MLSLDSEIGTSDECGIFVLVCGRWLKRGEVSVAAAAGGMWLCLVVGWEGEFRVTWMHVAGRKGR